MRRLLNLGLYVIVVALLSIGVASAQFTPNGSYIILDAAINSATVPVSAMAPGDYASWQICAPSSAQVNCFFYTGTIPGTAPANTFPVGGTYPLCVNDNQVQIVKVLPQAGIGCVAPTPTVNVASVARTG